MRFLATFLTIMIILAASPLSADTTITYQGQLQDASGPYTGTPDMVFRLYDNLTGTNQVGGDIELNNVPVTDGLFQAELDFGEVFDGPRWLELEVNGVTLDPRQRIASVPVAVQALSGGEDTLAELSCSADELAVFDGSAWTCAEPGDSDTLATLDCAADEVALFDGSQWICADVKVSDTLAALNCAGDQIARFDGAEWACAEDQDTVYSAGNGLTLSGTEFELDTGLTDGRYWMQGGNAGTDPTSDYIGTTDFTPFELHVQNLRALRIEPPGFRDADNGPNLVAGHQDNEVVETVFGATIAGGGGRISGDLSDIEYPNIVTGRYGSIGGGWSNTADEWATVGGGAVNTASGESSTVGGGERNRVNADFGTIAGGGPSDPADAENTRNEVFDKFGTIGGGGNNQAGFDDGDPESASFATVGGGRDNTASGESSTVGGGEHNRVNADFGTIAGGGPSDPADAENTRNEVFDKFGTIGGGGNNRAGFDDGDPESASFATVGGGWNNTAQGGNATVGGGWNNTASAWNATVAGGRNNTASSSYTTVAGGSHNTASWSYAMVGGGQDNTASRRSAMVGGGRDNTASARDATVAGGRNNTASAWNATVGGGRDNTASGRYSTVPGGLNNEALGQYSFAGGHDSVVDGTGHYSFAFGNNARASWEGQVVFTDSNEGQPNTNVEDRFYAKFDNGYRLETDADNSIGVWMGNGDTSWNSLSARKHKTNFESVDVAAVLDAVVELEISRWSYEWQTDIERIGPMAGEFYQAFGIGRDDEGIQTMDAIGVLYAAVQGLHAQLKNRDAELVSQAERMAKIEARNTELKSQINRVNQLEAENADLKDRLARLESVLLEDRQVAGGQQ